MTRDQPAVRAYAGKRVVDLAIAVPAVVMLLPVMAVIAGIVWLEDRHNPIFRQERVGANGAVFTLAKFRSMPIGAPSVASADAAALRVTRVGRVIRRTSLDELPQLFAILDGSMSVVGPRPALPTQDDVLVQRRSGGSASAKPGLTGWAQVNSFDGMPVETKVDFDNEYTARMSPWLDFKILLRTFGYLAKKPPAY